MESLMQYATWFSGYKVWAVGRERVIKKDPELEIEEIETETKTKIRVEKVLGQ